MITPQRHAWLLDRLKTGDAPFKGEQLYRADIEWLLSTPEITGPSAGAIENPSDGSLQHLRALDLRGAVLLQKDLQGLIFVNAQLQGAVFFNANLQGAYLHGAQLQGADLSGAQLQGATLTGAQLQGTKDLSPAHLDRAIFDVQTRLNGATLGDRTYGFVSVADTQWNGANVAAVDWSELFPAQRWWPWSKKELLQDESKARKKTLSSGETPIGAFQNAIRANRGLALAFQQQGMTIEAAELFYRVRDLQRIVYRLQRSHLEWLLACGLRVISGYGYRLSRSVMGYFGTLFVFWALYFVHSIMTNATTFHAMIGHHGIRVITETKQATIWLTWHQAAIMSITSFHGRGLFPSEIATSLWHGAFASVEAVIGLVVEATFIATLTQRFFR